MVRVQRLCTDVVTVTDRLPDMKIHLWRQFWRHMAGRKPSYREACDTMRLLEGHKHTEVGKILHFKRISSCVV